tara:strand:+ start:40 stop:978 length:939 start_codon:yes stop_codon:yes gene_type:complete
MIKIIRYEPNMKSIWDNFLKNESRNVNFLFYRSYMDYHSDRFEDYSLLFYEEPDVLIGIMPANIKDETIISHQGLTYGGVVIKKNIGTEKVLSIFENIIKYLKDNSIKCFVYKKIPYIYNVQPYDEDLYALFLFRFSLKIRDVSSAINLPNSSIKGKKVNGYKRALKSGFSLSESNDSSRVIDIVGKNLKDKYNLIPVHTSKELNLLKSRFPENIEFFELVYEREIVGGAILYLNEDIVHMQYITCKQEVKRLRGLDFLVLSIYKKFKDKYVWLNYGVSTENNGRFLNKSLIKSKEEFGFNAVCYDTYEILI